MHDIKKNIRRVFWLYFLMFLTVIVYLGKFILIDGDEIVNSSYNPRLNRNDYTIKRGSIYDANGVVLAESVPDGDLFKRVYPIGSDFAHTVGFIHKSKSGVEAKYNFTLNTLDLEVWQRIKNIAVGDELEGDSVILTLDSQIQALAAAKLGENKGGIVAIEPSTGKIIAMVSSPGFDPNKIYENWESLSSDNTNSPLINRTTQGLYPPGSIFKIISADAVIENMENYEDYHYECTGSAVFNGYQIRCFDSKAHGTVDLHDALKYSCNTYFASAIMEIGYDKLAACAEKAMFNTNYPFDLEVVGSKFSVADYVETDEIIQTAIGQGRTVVTPLHMAMIASAVANGGTLMQPYICAEVRSFNGGLKFRADKEVLGDIFSEETCEILTEMMVSVVEGGTATNAKIDGIALAGKTGTAENETNEAHGWFIAFAPADDPKIAIAVVTENSGGARSASAIAKEVISAYLK